jgi:hypothetical protein
VTGGLSNKGLAGTRERVRFVPGGGLLLLCERLHSAIVHSCLDNRTIRNGWTMDAFENREWYAWPRLALPCLFGMDRSEGPRYHAAAKDGGLLHAP